MALNSLRSGWATLEYEIAERGRRRSDGSDGGLRLRWRHLPHIHQTRPNEQSAMSRRRGGICALAFHRAREACGLNDSAHVMRTYGVPKEVCCPHGAIPHTQHPSGGSAVCVRRSF